MDGEYRDRRWGDPVPHRHCGPRLAARRSDPRILRPGSRPPRDRPAGPGPAPRRWAGAPRRPGARPPRERPAGSGHARRRWTGAPRRTRGAPFVCSYCGRFRACRVIPPRLTRPSRGRAGRGGRSPRRPPRAALAQTSRDSGRGMPRQGPDRGESPGRSRGWLPRAGPTPSGGRPAPDTAGGCVGRGGSPRCNRQSRPRAAPGRHPPSRGWSPGPDLVVAGTGRRARLRSRGRDHHRSQPVVCRQGHCRSRPQTAE